MQRGKKEPAGSKEPHEIISRQPFIKLRNWPQLMGFRYQIILISVLIGLMAGMCSSAFLYALEHTTNIRMNYSWLIWGLPLFGFFFGYILKKTPSDSHHGVPYIQKELDNPKATFSPWTTPFVFIAALGTHLFGGSAGREGVGVIMGVGTAHMLPKFNLSYEKLRPYLIYCGIAAGFSSIFGTPLAAVVFSFELYRFKDLKKSSLLIASIISSFTAFYISHFLGPAHPTFSVPFSFNFETAKYVVIAAFTSGIGGLIFYGLFKLYSAFISKLIPRADWKLAIGGLIVALTVYTTHGYDYVGIGTDMIHESFQVPMVPYDFIMKCILTVMTLGVGFKGGEVTPLFFMGATFSNSVATLLKLKNFALSSSLGMVALFGAVTGTPIASMVMGAELFGWKIGILCAITCFFARWIMGRKTIYRL